MSIEVICDPTATMHHIAHVRNYIFPTDISTAEGGGDTGSDPHDLCDSAHAFS
jgi:putative redox protein